MNWLTSFSFLLTLFLSLQIPADSRGFGAASKSPWANIKKANDFMNCLIQNIAKSSVFPQQEKEDMESIVATMMSAISSMSTQQRGNTQAQLQAMNMAFASSMAELVIAEDAGNEQAIAVKTNALSQALKVCFKSVMGSINRQFIAEIKDLIQMFAKEAASGAEDSDVDDQGDFASSEGMQSNYNVNNVASTNSITFDSSSSGGAYTGTQSNLGGQSFGPYGDNSGYGQTYGVPGGQGPAGDTSRIANVIAQALASSQTLQALVRSGASSGVVGQIISTSLQSTLSSSLGMSSSVSGGIISSVQNTLSSLGGRIDIGSLSSSLSSVLVSALEGSGLINAGNASTIGVALVSGLIQTVSRIAAQFGVRISVDVSSDLRSLKNLVQTSISSQATSLTAQSTLQTSFDVGVPRVSSGLGTPNLGSLLSSPNGLTSPRATARIQSLSSNLADSIRNNGMDINGIAKSLSSLSSDAQSSGLSPTEAKLEALLETVVALLNILSSARVGSVNAAAAASVSSNVAASLASVLA